MKQLGMIAVLIGLTCSAMAEQVGSSEDQDIGVFVTGMGVTGNKTGGAFGGGLKYEWLFSQNLGIDVHGGYLNEAEARMGLIPLELGPVAVLPLDPLSLTFGVGGLYGIPTNGNADPALGFYASAGIRGPLSNGMEWFAEAHYENVKGDDKLATVYTPFGYTTTKEPRLDLRGGGLNVGILWKF